MQTTSRMFDDLARLASGAVGTAHGIKAEWENILHQRMERMVGEMNLVPREEFDAVKEMVVKLVDKVDAQAEQIAELEARLAAASASPAPAKKASGKTAARPAPKSTGKADKADD
ncbi:accessory factor UbiK family protein [Sneathiella chinensis]|uniref:Pyrroline-5-carboxylate reductase n=1 Tax=Sneathiella chinensis TaxID=349750 RepID=A0ABQ5U282_9PROT|nr:accessory factor UbiK family protein [Sneathiella chinensis]GLQ06232.1 hypothetical protein GCM10007924_14530 [Sneathiella chinensis]